MRTASRGGVIHAVGSVKGKQFALLYADRGADRLLNECVQIYNEGESLRIVDNVCERCTVDFVRNFVAKDNVSGCIGKYKKLLFLLDLVYISTFSI